MSEAVDRYEADVFCTNCGYEGPVTPPVGERVSQQPCPLCANDMLMPAALRDWERERWREPE